uniref:Interleukin 32 n=1 Tax=Bos indicus x Bos taurus TaxID=30522 RepID=A0A4W2H9W7_BOBOX
MESGALAPFRLTWMHGRPHWGPLTSAARQECRLHTSSPQEKFIKDAFKVMDNHIQENSPETLKESSPLLQEARQEVRCRIQRRSVSTSLEVQNPEESIWARALRQFLGILQSFLSGCRDALTWLWEKAAACLQAICSAVEALWEVLTDFSSFVGQLLCRSLIQV